MFIRAEKKRERKARAKTPAAPSGMLQASKITPLLSRGPSPRKYSPLPTLSNQEEGHCRGGGAGV